MRALADLDSATTKLHLLLARPTLNDAQLETARALLGQVEDGQAFVVTAARKFSLPIVLPYLDDIGFTKRFPDASRQARELAVKFSASRLLISAEQRKFHQTCIETEDVECAYFKGTTLDKYYPKPGMRFCRDVDLLLSGKDRRKVIQRALSNGYRVVLDPHQGALATSSQDVRAAERYLSEIILLSPSGVIFELHTHLDRHVSIFDADRMLWEAERDDIYGYEFPVLPLDLHFVYLCYHACHHLWSQLHWLADLDALMHSEAFDRNAIAERAKALGLGRTVDACFEFHELSTNPELWAQADPDSKGFQLLQACVDNLGGGRETEISIRHRGVGRFFDWRAPEGRSLEFAAKRLLFRLKPKITQYISLPLPDRLQGLYYFTRLFYAAKLGIRREKGDAR